MKTAGSRHLLNKNPEWLSLRRCPACERNCASSLGSLRKGDYVFGSQLIQKPTVDIIRCACGLVYKQTVPSPVFLKTVMESEHGNLWSNTYDYRDEISLVTGLAGKHFDQIDIGPAVGGLLKAMPNQGRKSGLDVVRFDGLEIRGEFIAAFIDDREFAWSGDPYDVVTAFDIFEHLYDPSQAFRNIRNLLAPGGYLILETGNAGAVRQGSLKNWYYLSYFEHHMAWDENSLNEMAQAHEFEVVHLEFKRHKLWNSRRGSARDWFRYGLHAAAPAAYRFLQATTGRAPTTPAAPGAKDHLRAVLRRRP